jgi:hypothetical protein
MLPPATAITLAQHASRSDDALFQEVGGEAVLLDLASEKYFGLDPVGTRIWNLLGEDGDLQSVYEHICSEYDAEPELIASDLLALIGQLAEAGLVKLT